MNQLPPIPKVCDCCKSERIEFVLNREVYGENKGNWPYCYLCHKCGAMTNCHEGTNRPLGLMAKSRIRRLRGTVHRLFDPIWQNNYMDRNDAYKWLASQLGRDGEIHISAMLEKELKSVIEILRPHSDNEYRMFARRKEKANGRARERKQRQGSRIVRRKYSN